MKNLLLSLAMLTLGLVVDVAHARGFANQVAIINVDTRTDGSFLVTFSQPITTAPSCTTDLSRMSGTTSSPGGKSVLAAAMFAFAAGSPVTAHGTGSCSQFSGIESIEILTQSK